MVELSAVLTGNLAADSASNKMALKLFLEQEGGDYTGVSCCCCLVLFHLFVCLVRVWFCVWRQGLTV